MIAHNPIVLACRTRLLTLEVCTTGTMALASTATGFTRLTGSFLTDGFRVGMQLTPTGFTGTAPEVITAVSALTMTTDTAHTAQASAGSRALAVKLPALPSPEAGYANRAWEGVPFKAVQGIPYIAEEYLPGVQSKIALGARGTLEGTPLYVVKVYGPIGNGRDALGAYADAILAHFAAGQTMTLSTGDTARVRSDIGPTPSQMLRDDVWHVVTVTIPLRIYSTATP